MAPRTLGWVLCRRWGAAILRGRIVEVEAYAGHSDLASHARRGPTNRNRPMFGPVGHAYVYFIYGTHFCLNIVAHDHCEAGAILVRALEPLEGVEAMRELRGGKPDLQLCSGPGKLCQALAIDRSLDGIDLLEPGELWLEEGSPAALPLRQGPRIGIRQAVDLPWRFWVQGNPHVSRPC